MKFSLWTKFGALNSKPVFEAFGKSLRNFGHTVTENDPDADVDVIWSVLWSGRMAHNKAIFDSRKPTIVLEVGGIQRCVTWKIGLNGISRGNCLITHGNNSDRVNQLGLRLKPWRESGDNILICCQNPKSLLWADMPPLVDWLENTVAEIRQHTDRHIIIRQHPRAPIRGSLRGFENISYQKPQKLPGTYDCFDFDLRNVHAVVNWSSNPGPQSIIQGVPAFVGPDSLACGVGNCDFENIESPNMPDRTQWFNDFVYSEYTLNEISQGLPLFNLLNRLTFLKNNSNI